MITLFTDGSSRGNPGPGGWGSVLVVHDGVRSSASRSVADGQESEIGDRAQVVELGGGEAHTTNNRMELTAAIRGLERAVNTHETADDGEQIVVCSDSSYVINGVTKWMAGWKRNGWVTKTKDDVSNKDLWMDLDRVVSGIGQSRVSWRYVGGHIGIGGNERCDEIATSFADGQPTKLYSGRLSGYSIPDILNISHDEAASSIKKSSSARSRTRAYSYVSAIRGDIRVHKTWDECEKRVKGVGGARFKKSVDAQDEAEIVREFAR